MMANGHVEIHDVLSNHGDVGGSSDPESPAGSMAGTAEFRLLMAYATRRRPVKESPPSKDVITLSGDANESAPTKTDMEEKRTEGKKKKKKKGWKRLPSIFKCVKPQTEDSEEPPARAPPPANNQLRVKDRCFHPEAPEEQPDEAEDDNPLAAVARRLTALADDVPLVPPDIEADAPEVTGSHSREVEAMIGLLLRESGDRLYEKELKDVNVAAELFWNYDFFRSLLNAVLDRMGLRSRHPDAPGPQASPKTQIAVACEITSRLSALETLSTMRLLDNGARYLQDVFSPWVRQQGGYEAAFQEDEDDEVQ